MTKVEKKSLTNKTKIHLPILFVSYIFFMEKKEVTKVGCQSCKTDSGVKNVQRFIYIFGGLLFSLAVYGAVRLVSDISSLF